MRFTSSSGTKPSHEFAHNRSFELRLKNAENLLAEREKQQQHQQPLPKARKWVSRKIESRQSSIENAKNCSKSRSQTECSISKLAESNRLASFRSGPSPIPAYAHAGSGHAGYNDCSAVTSSAGSAAQSTMDCMHISGLSEGGDSGIFTSSYHSDHDPDSTFRLSVSQSFGKSFPDINEDTELLDVDEEEDIDTMFAERMKASRSFNLSSSYTSESKAPAKPKRSMITSYSNLNLRHCDTRETSQVKAKVQMFENMSSNKSSVDKTKLQSQNCDSKLNSEAIGKKPLKFTRNKKKPDAMCTPKRQPQLTPTPTETNCQSMTPAPIMSVSSSSSAASCGYKDFLIDDDYKDQQQLILARELGQNASSIDETLKEKINTYLGQNEKETNEKINKSDDEKSVREIIEKPEKEDDHSSSIGTLSEQESIRSETETGVYDIENNNDLLHSLREDNFYTTDENHNDLIQDVLDVNVLLCKLKSILMENGMMDENMLTLSGREKIDSKKEKSVIDENNELKKQILSLQSNLEDKQKRINSLEMQLTSQMKALNNAFTQT